MTNQERNEQVARKLGWTSIVVHRHEENVDEIVWQWQGISRGGVPDYCGSIQAAWEIMDHCIQERKLFSLHWDARGWFCRMGEGSSDYVETAPLAIVRAFLKLP